MKYFKIITVVVFLLLLTSCKCTDANEIANWHFGNGADQTCPLFGGYPIHLYSTLPAKYMPDLREAANRWNRVSQSLSAPAFFSLDGPGRVSVLVESAPDSEPECAPLKLGATDLVQDNTFAWTQYRPAGGLWTGARIQMCVAKYEAARQLQRTPAAQRVREQGMYGILLHELGHLLIGPNHPRMYGGVMASKPRSIEVTYHVTELLRLQVVDVCKQNGRLP